MEQLNLWQEAQDLFEQMGAILKSPVQPEAHKLNARPDHQAIGSPWKIREVVLNGYPITYRVCRCKRRSVGFLIDDEGLHVRIPKWLTEENLQRALQQKATWILDKLLTWQNERNKRQLPDIYWQIGNTFPFVDTPVTLALPDSTHPLQQSYYDAQSHILYLALPKNHETQQIRDAAVCWLKAQAQQNFAQRVQFFSDKLGVYPRKLSLSSARTRWGSCTAQGDIRLNWRLIYFSQSTIDYVIAHELAHLKELNHSQDFWKTVANLYPDYKAAQNQLKQLSHLPPEW